MLVSDAANAIGSNKVKGTGNDKSGDAGSYCADDFWTPDTIALCYKASMHLREKCEAEIKNLCKLYNVPVPPSGIESPRVFYELIRMISEQIKK